jgi:hypothetical protein
MITICKSFFIVKQNGVLNLAIDWKVQFKPDVTPMPSITNLIESYVFGQNIVKPVRRVE